MLLFDDSKRLEKALGEEAATALAHVFERADENWRGELATKADVVAVKADLSATRADLKAEIAAIRENMATKADLTATKAEIKAELATAEVRILRWLVAGFLAQTVLLVAIMSFLR